MKRRELFTTFAFGAWVLISSRPGKAGNTRKVGILMGSRREDPDAQERIRALVERLRELGWNEGDNIAFDIKWTSSDKAAVRTSAEALVSDKPDVLFANNAAMIPDDLAELLAGNFRKPSTNITGITNFDPIIAAKWVEYLNLAVPGLAKVTVLLQDGNAAAPLYRKHIESATANTRIDAFFASCRTRSDIEEAISATERPLAGLIVPPSALVSANKQQIANRAADSRIPAIYAHRDYVEAGGLLSYGSDRKDIYRDAALYIDRLLRGAAVSDLPVRAPTKIELVISRSVARKMNLRFPDELVAAADDYID